MVQSVNNNVIVTNDGRKYKKPGITSSIAGFYAGSAAQAVVSSASIPASILLMKNIRKINSGIDNTEISKAIKNLGYSPEYDFKKGIALAIDWYKKHL